MDPTLAGDAAAVTRATRHVPQALEGFQEEGLVSLDDARFVFCPMPGCLMPKAVAPQECGVLVDPTTAGGIMPSGTLSRNSSTLIELELA